MRKSDRQAIGCCAVGTYDIDGRQELELGYWVGESFWGTGYATEAMAGLVEPVRHQAPARRIISLITPTNAASIRVAEKNGMHLEKETWFRGGKIAVYVNEFGEEV